MPIIDTLKQTLGIDDNTAQAAEQQIRNQLQAQGFNPTDDEISNIITGVASKLGTTQTQPAQSNQPTWNAPNEVNAAQQKYADALADIKSRRSTSNLGQALLSKFNPDRVAKNNQRYDQEAALAKDATIGTYDRLNKANQEQQASNWQQEQQNRARTGWSREDSKYNQDQSDIAAQRDPNSSISQSARDAVANIGKTMNMTIPLSGNESYEQITKIYPYLKDQLDAKVHADQIEANKQIARDNAAARRETAETNAALRRDTILANNDQKQSQQEQKQIQNLSKDVSTAQDVLTSIDSFENAARSVTGQDDFNIDSYDPVAQTYKGADGKSKTVDLPGVSLPVIGRTNFYSSKARLLNQSASNIFNVTLKDRSGAAVTNNEMERLKTEFGSGQWNTEAELINGIKRYKQALINELKNREAAYTDDVKGKYRSEGGKLSNDYQPTSKVVSTPQVTTPTPSASNTRKVTLKDGRKVVIDDQNNVVGTW